ncbi:sugar phosphate isomerase/epimerase family protein [Dethiosulfatarculus sandiegensis]|uniref:Xylose isomerase-like TIM barrel domain-containing protein n=1 Tax=Dethiosulfatarculus sandiegensis TaxID=1429043 RepID=A0A0D2JG13_9BACT|nr:sugar phosphate isomerase/epimerase [Dethiosulfatarculus sandiegensis]KIX14651.1 hypothetical protein X474_08195 [Dethiosulfatarculus sandiegensis]
MNTFDPVPALSTCWASENCQSAADLLDQIRKTGFDKLELEYRLTTPILQDLLPELKPRGLKISSIHNFCPLPLDMDPALAGGDLFNLASRDKETRQRAVSLTTSCLEMASDLEVERLVLHLGWVEGLENKQVIKLAAGESASSAELTRQLEYRNQLAPAFRDAVSFSLEKLFKRAEPLGVVLGIENRYHAFEIPDLTEAQLLLKRFKGAPLGHWHDLGHALVQQAAGLPGPDKWLTAFGRDLVGCHLHDTLAEKDHLPPGQGDASWPDLLPLLVDSPCFVMEVHPGPEPDEIKESAQMITELLHNTHAQKTKGKEAHEDSSGGGGHGKGQPGTLTP